MAPCLILNFWKILKNFELLFFCFRKIGPLNIRLFGKNQQWRSQKFGLGGAVGRFWLKSLVNIAIYCEYIDF
jgi:hypothetical protein